MRLRGHAFHVVHSASNLTIQYDLSAHYHIAERSPATLCFAYHCYQSLSSELRRYYVCARTKR